MTDYLPPTQYSQPLPIPVVKLGVSAEHPLVDNGVAPTADGTITPAWDNYPLIHAMNVPESLLNPDLDLRLELLWYKGAGRSYKAGYGYKKIAAGFKHPIDFDASTNHASSDTHDGITNNVSGTRISEWSITSRNQVIAVNLSGYLRVNNTPYRDSGTASVLSLPIAVPAWVKTAVGPNGASNLKGINRRAKNLYVGFRYSIKDWEQDPVNGRGRIVGAMSPVIAGHHRWSPFLEDVNYPLANGGQRAYTAAPGFDINALRCSFVGRKRI